MLHWVPVGSFSAGRNICVHHVWLPERRDFTALPDVMWSTNCWLGIGYVQPSLTELNSPIRLDMSNAMEWAIPHLYNLVFSRSYAWWRFADQFHNYTSLPCSCCTLFSHVMLVFVSIPALWETFAFWMWSLGWINQQNITMHNIYWDLTRVKTSPGCVYTTLFQTNPGRTRVSSVYTTETNPG